MSGRSGRGHAAPARASFPGTQVRKQFELQFLDLHEPFPLVRQQLIDLLVQGENFECGLEVDLMVVLRADAGLR